MFTLKFCVALLKKFNKLWISGRNFGNFLENDFWTLISNLRSEIESTTHEPKKLTFLLKNKVKIVDRFHCYYFVSVYSKYSASPPVESKISEDDISS